MATVVHVPADDDAGTKTSQILSVPTAGSPPKYALVHCPTPLVTRCNHRLSTPKRVVTSPLTANDSPSLATLRHEPLCAAAICGMAMKPVAIAPAIMASRGVLSPLFLCSTLVTSLDLNGRAQRLACTRWGGVTWKACTGHWSVERRVSCQDGINRAFGSGTGFGADESSGKSEQRQHHVSIIRVMN
jgi:hypothetical protein